MANTACVKFFNADIRESGEQFEYFDYHLYEHNSMRAVKFDCANGVEKLYNFDRIISITLSKHDKSLESE